MPTPQLSDRTVDDLVAGRPVFGEADLVAAIGVLAASARVAPPPPSTALAALLDDGGAPALTGVLSTDRPARWASGRRWATGGAVGISAALLTLTGAAAAQALPSPLQRAVSGAVRALTPFELPGGHDQTPHRDADPAPVVPGGAAAEQDGEQGSADGFVIQLPDGDERTDEADVRDEGRGADGGEAAEDEGGDGGGDDDAPADVPAGNADSEVGDSDTYRDATGRGPYTEDSRGGGTDQNTPDQDARDGGGGGAASPAEAGEPTGTHDLGADEPGADDLGAN